MSRALENIFMSRASFFICAANPIFHAFDDCGFQQIYSIILYVLNKSIESASHDIVQVVDKYNYVC